MEICKRCGYCCHYLDNGQIKKCRYLVKHGSSTSCRIYNNRLGTKISKDYTCVRRVDTLNDYKGCPYNTNKPILDIV